MFFGVVNDCIQGKTQYNKVLLERERKCGDGRGVVNGKVWGGEGKGGSEADE